MTNKSTKRDLTITVNCNYEDTVVVIGQNVWQCCKCGSSYPYSSSIDQHLLSCHGQHVGQKDAAKANKQGTTNDDRAVLIER